MAQKSTYLRFRFLITGRNPFGLKVYLRDFSKLPWVEQVVWVARRAGLHFALLDDGVSSWCILAQGQSKVHAGVHHDARRYDLVYGGNYQFIPCPLWHEGSAWLTQFGDHSAYLLTGVRLCASKQESYSQFYSVKCNLLGYFSKLSFNSTYQKPWLEVGLSILGRMWNSSWCCLHDVYQGAKEKHILSWDDTGSKRSAGEGEKR